LPELTRDGLPHFARRGWLATGVVFAAIFVLRLLDSEPLAFWDMLYAVPVVWVARLSGVRRALTAVVLAIVLVAVWAGIKGVDLDVQGYAARACGLILCGVVAALPLRREPSPGGSVPSDHDLRRRQALQFAVLGTWELDLATDAMAWSDEYHDLYGVDPQVFPSSRAAFREIVHPDDRDVLEEAIQRIVDDGVVAEVRYRIIRPSDEEERCIRSHMHCERDAAGRPIAVLGTGQDVTDLVMVLTPREREMLMLLAEGLSGEQIAELFTLSPATVRTHINNAMNKLGAHTRGQAIAIALRSDEIGS
jgi:DNA-binding CsgD family transcriptional regulator